MPYLTIRMKGKRLYHTHLIEGDSCMVGRSSKCDLTMDHESISRNHCKFFKDDDDNWMVEDLGSKHGLRIDASSKLEGPQPIGEGQIVKIGSGRLTWHIADDIPESVKRREGKDFVSRERKEREAGEGRTVLAHEVGENDPPEAMPCPKCGTWISITHRIPSERIRCPACDNKVPVVELVEASA